MNPVSKFSLIMWPEPDKLFVQLWIFCGVSLIFQYHHCTALQYQYVLKLSCTATEDVTLSLVTGFTVTGNNGEN